MKNKIFRIGILAGMLFIAVSLSACAKKEVKYNAKSIKLAKQEKSENKKNGKRKDGDGKSENQKKDNQSKENKKEVQKNQQETVKQNMKQDEFDLSRNHCNENQQQAKANKNAGNNQGSNRILKGKRGDAGTGDGHAGEGAQGSGNRGADGNGDGNGNVGNSPNGKDGQGNYDDGKPGRTVKKPKIIYTIKNQ